ncbi:MAG: BlaI/MecI/CopY family transcriptional regulator, partial [Salinivirgaceae bacterium]|nr:BlaI/MecI/CopY family transcriptional regulator [Salinivirgaceae bacterium]
MIGKNKNSNGENLRELTRAEMEVMLVLWAKERALTKDILDEMPEPKPAYNTV